jgi:hypothetical protein
MKGTYAFLGIAALLFAIAPAWSVNAQHHRMQMGHYDRQTETTISGTVVTIEKSDQGQMPCMCLHLTLKTDTDNVRVHLGPVAFVEKTMTFKEGDAVQVIGSKVTMMGRQAVIAREVKKGSDTLKLRDESGAPLWSGGPGGRK